MNIPAEPVTKKTTKKVVVKKKKKKDPDSKWDSFEDDGLHDPTNPAFGLLQRPAEALKDFPPNQAGNMVNWVTAITEGHINPRTNIFPETKVNILDLDIFMDLNGALPIVRFPHRPHTLWLDCANCHDQIFKQKAGATKFTMSDILSGQYCGQCHGAVAFPLTDCARCHSVKHKDLKTVLANTKNYALAK